MTTTERPELTRHPTSIRLSQAEEQLLDAWAANFRHEYGVQLSRSGVIRFLLHQFRPAVGPHPSAIAVRRAHRAAYGT